LAQHGGVGLLLHYFSAQSGHFLQKNYLKISLQFPAGYMERPLIGCCTSNIDSLLTKLGSELRGKF
jgi:hypothetical protein